MTETLVAVTPSKKAAKNAADAVISVPGAGEVDELEVARELVRQAREAGVAVTGPGGLLKAMTKTVIETGPRSVGSGARTVVAGGVPW